MLPPTGARIFILQKAEATLKFFVHVGGNMCNKLSQLAMQHC